VRILCLALGFILAAGCVARAEGGAEPPAVAPAVTALVVLRPQFDFGTVPAGSVVEHDFVLENRGAAALRIEKVRSSCGCTVGQVAAAEVAPGGQTTVQARFDTTGRSGRQDKEVFVTSNAPTNPLLVCRLTGTVEPAPPPPTPAIAPAAAPATTASNPAPVAASAAGTPTATPARVAAPPGLAIHASSDGILFLDVPAGTAAERTVTLREQSGRAFEPATATSGCAGLTWRFTPLSADRSAWQVTATYRDAVAGRSFRCQARVISASGESVSLFVSGNTVASITP
jgi:hypothetical protein